MACHYCQMETTEQIFTAVTVQNAAKQTVSQAENVNRENHSV
jgi:hypothetical protein